MDYDTEQKPLRVNYMTLDRSGNITTVVDGHAWPGPTLAELTEERALTAFTETISEMSYDEQPDDDPHGACRHEIARLQARIRELERELHGAKNRAEMACHQEECGDCPGCSRAYELNGDPLADWTVPPP